MHTFKQSTFVFILELHLKSSSRVVGTSCTCTRVHTYIKTHIHMYTVEANAARLELSETCFHFKEQRQRGKNFTTDVPLTSSCLIIFP